MHDNVVSRIHHHHHYMFNVRFIVDHMLPKRNDSLLLTREGGNTINNSSTQLNTVSGFNFHLYNQQGLPFVFVKTSFMYAYMYNLWKGKVFGRNFLQLLIVKTMQVWNLLFVCVPYPPFKMQCAFNIWCAWWCSL